MRGVDTIDDKELLIRKENPRSFFFSKICSNLIYLFSLRERCFTFRLFLFALTEREHPGGLDIVIEPARRIIWYYLSIVLKPIPSLKSR